MKSYLATAFICLFSLLLVPSLASANDKILISPDNLPQVCRTDIQDPYLFPEKLATYIVRNLMWKKDDPSQIKFNISASNLDFFGALRPVATAAMQRQLESFKQKGKGLYVVFTVPGSTPDMQASHPESLVDFFLIAAMNIEGRPMCVVLSDAFGIGWESYAVLPETIRSVMDAAMAKQSAATAQAQGLIVPRDDTANQMFTACSNDFIANNLAPTSVGYLVENGEVGIGTGRFYFAIEGGADGISYDVAEPQGTAAVSLLTSLANSTDHTKTALFAVFGQPLGKNGTVSVTLYAFDKYRPQKCVLLTPPENVFLRQEHLPPRVKQMLEEGWPEQAALQ